MEKKELLERFASGKATAAELAQFWEWLSTMDEAEYGALLSDYELVWSAQTDHGAPDLSLLQKIRDRKDAYERGMSRTPVIRRWLTVAAAAACLLVFAGGYWLWYRPAGRTPGAVAAEHSPVLAPGGAKAILTLGDGSRIVLDNVAEGTVARQGGTLVVKETNGQLAYQPSGGEGGKVYNNTLEVPRGGEYQLVLPDGTRVWLNAASSITYPNVFSDKSRNVAITGEAYFEVAGDASRPFVVSSRGVAIQVLGTAFDLMAYTDEDAIEATLVNGAVKVIKGDRSQVIQPGEQASVAGGQEEIRVTRPDMDQVLAWKNGKFQFGDRSDVTSIMRQVKRWYDVDVEYQGAVSSHIGGSISRNVPASQVFRMLETTGGVHFTIEGRKVIVRP